MKKPFSSMGSHASGAIPISGTGTILTSTRKLGPSSTTTPALHSLGMSKDGVLILGDVKKSRPEEVEIENQRKQTEERTGGESESRSSCTASKDSLSGLGGRVGTQE